MKWILIFWISGYQAGGPASATFESKAACEDAVRVISERLGERTKNFVCIPAGEAK